MDAHQPAATHDGKLPGVPVQQSMLAGVEEVGFLLCGRACSQRGGKPRLPSKKRYLTAVTTPAVSRAQRILRPRGSEVLQILMPASGSLSNFFFRGNCGTALGAALGAGTADAAAACRPPMACAGLRLLAGGRKPEMMLAQRLRSRPVRQKLPRLSREPSDGLGLAGLELEPALAALPWPLLPRLERALPRPGVCSRPCRPEEPVCHSEVSGSQFRPQPNRRTATTMAGLAEDVGRAIRANAIGSTGASQVAACAAGLTGELAQAGPPIAGLDASPHAFRCLGQV